jgi:hypothetical protein
VLRVRVASEPEVSAGKRRRSCGASLRLLTRTGGRPTTASGMAAPTGAAAARLRKEEDDPGAMGQSGLRAGPAMKNPRKMENGMPTWFGPKSELGCRFDFEFYFKDLSLKSKDSNTFKPNLNLGQTRTILK